MQETYKFFNDFIITKIDLDNAEQRQAYYLLKTIECIYKLDQDIFTELKQLINNSKSIHKQVKLQLVPNGQLRTGANWSPFEKAINLELPTCTDAEFSAYGFIHGLIFELSNSVNKIFSSFANLLLLSEVSNGDLRVNGFLTELAEFESELLQYYIRNKIQQNINNESSEQLTNKILEFATDEEKPFILKNLILLGALSPSIMEITNNTFEEYWESVNSKDNDRGCRHTDAYDMPQEQDPQQDSYETKLNKAYEEIVQQIQRGSFHLTNAQQKYSNLLTEAANQSIIKKSEYYFLYQIIMQDGKRLEELDLGLTTTELAMLNHQIGFFFDISLIVEKVANGIINFNQLSSNDKNFISLAFAIIDYCQQTESMNDARIIIAKKFMPKLQLIQNLNNTLLIDAHKNIISAFNSILLSENKQQLKLTPEIMGLIANANNIRSMWRHQTEVRVLNNSKSSVLFTFNLIGGKLNINNNGKATYSSLPRICFK